MMAARNSRPDLVRFLLDNGANINAKAGDGKTALSLVTKDNNTEMITLLKKLGAARQLVTGRYFKEKKIHYAYYS